VTDYFETARIIDITGTKLFFTLHWVRVTCIAHEEDSL